jgi:hypothetical protein
MNPTTYFSTLNFSKADTDKFLSLVCLDVKEMKKQVTRYYGLGSLRPFHVLPFAKWPLVRIGDIVFCVSVQLLNHKLTDGLHHLFLDDTTRTISG